MRVYFYATFRDIVGGKFIDLDLEDGVTVQKLLDRVLFLHPGLRGEMLDEAGQLSQHVHIFVNGRGCVFLEQGLDTPLSTRDDRIDFFPAVAGG
ncbi:MAG: MoaD family protein [Deltaproteobacteria bacterium]|nr:MoaD family protein [Deltaproteobacteria bacterium]